MSARWIPGWLDAYLSMGLEDASEQRRRRVQSFNLISFVGAWLAILFGILFLLYDAAGLWPIAATGALAAALLFTGPITVQINEAGAITFSFVVVLFLLMVNTYMTGKGSGLHLFLIDIPALYLISTGMARPRLVAAISLVAAVATVYAEVQFIEPSGLVTVDPFFNSVVRTSVIASVFGLTFYFVFYALRRMTRAEDALAAEHARSERLLDNLLPEKIAARLKNEPDQIIADDLGQVTILFADIVDFTPRAASLEAAELVRFLNSVFTAFDAETDARGLEKIKTIGDAYMVAAGMPEARDDHASAVADMALAMLGVTRRLSAETGQSVEVRIGIHTGPAVAGVIGTRKFFYDVWGDTVNTAARMESHGDAGRIQITEETRNALGDDYTFERRGLVDIKGKGAIQTFWLTGKPLSR